MCSLICVAVKSQWTFPSTFAVPFVSWWIPICRFCGYSATFAVSPMCLLISQFQFYFFMQISMRFMVMIPTHTSIRLYVHSCSFIWDGGVYERAPHMSNLSGPPCDCDSGEDSPFIMWWCPNELLVHQATSESASCKFTRSLIQNTRAGIVAVR